MLFSNDKGLLKGNTLDFSNFEQQGIWATDVTFSMGLPVAIPALPGFFRPALRGRRHRGQIRHGTFHFTGANHEGQRHL